MPGIKNMQHADLNLPLIDFANYHSSPEDATAVGKALYNACKDVGFAYLINTRIPRDEVKQMFEWSAKLFALPQEEKLKAPHPPEGWKHRGYSGVGVEQVSQMVFDPEKLAEIRKQAPDFKESFDMGNEADNHIKNIWLPEESIPGFKDFAVHFWKTCREFQKDLLGALSVGMPEVPEGFLNEYHSDGRNQLRLLHYPSAPKESFSSGTKGRINAHTDFGTCTLLFQDDAGGLEVEDPRKPGEFMSAPPIPGAIVFNVGDFLMRWSNNTLKSTLHRVRAPLASDDGSGNIPERFSIPYFMSADGDKVIDALPGTFSAENPKRFAPISSGEYLNKRLNATYI